jgi:hypothetical protein
MPSPLHAAICLIGRGIENIDGGLCRLGGSLRRVLSARSEMATTLCADIRFARPNIQIYDAHAVDLYQWVCARYARPKEWVLAERESVNPH